MHHGGEAARPTTVEGSADLGTAGAVRSGEAHVSTGTLHGQLGAAAGRRAGFDEFARHVHAAVGRGEVPVAAFHREAGPGLAYANMPRPGAGRVLVLVDLLPGGGGVGTVYSRDYVLQSRSGAGHGEVLVDLLPDAAGDGEAFVGQLPGGGVPAYGDYGYYALQPHPGAGHGEVLVYLLPDDAGHGEAFVGQLPGGGVPAYGDYGYYALQPQPVAGHGEVLLDLLPDGAGHGEVLVDLLPDAAGDGEAFVGQLPGGGVPAYGGYGYYALQPHPGAGHGEVLVYLLPDDAGHGEAFVGQLPGGGVPAYGDYGYYALQPQPVAGHGEVLLDLLPDGAGHGAVFVGLLPRGGGAVHDGYYPWQPRPGVGSGEVFIGPLPDGVGAVFLNSSRYAQQTLPGTGRADGMAGALRVRSLGAGYDGSAALADDLGAAYHNRGIVTEHLRRLLPFAGIGALSMAINGLAGGPGSPAVAFHLFVLFLGGLFLVFHHVLRV